MKFGTITVLLLSAAVVLAQGPGPRGGGPGRPGMSPGGPGGRGMGILESHVVTGAPFSAVEVLTFSEKFADGNSVNTTTSTGRARDGQGRTWTSETVTPLASAGKAPYTRVTISDPVASYRYELNSSTMIAMQSRMPMARLASASSASSSSASSASAMKAQAAPATVTRSNGALVTTSSLGSALVNGVFATHSQVTELIPAGAIGNAQAITTTRTTWVSPDLKLPVQIKSNDPRFGSSDMELTNIALGEPSASLFAVPAGYTVRKAGFGPGRQGGPGANHAPGGRGPGGPGAFHQPGGPPSGGASQSQ